MAATIRLSQQHSCSFDHLIGEREQPVWNLEAERLRGLEVDDQLEFGRHQHGQVGRFFALEDAARVNTGLAKGIRKAGAVADEAAGRGEFAPRIHCRYSVVFSKSHEPFAPASEEWGGDNNDCVGPQLRESGKATVELAFDAGLNNVDFLPEGGCDILQVL